MSNVECDQLGHPIEYHTVSVAQRVFDHAQKEERRQG